MQVIDYRTTKFIMIPHFEINLRKSVEVVPKWHV